MDLSETLRSGVTVDALLKAVSASGYPTQSITAERLRAALSRSSGPVFMQEEWSFLDGERDTVRQLDILAAKHFEIPSGFPSHSIDRPTDFRALLRYELDMFVECKKSELPYLFFLRDGAYNPTVPELHGFPHADIEYGESEDQLFVRSPVIDLLRTWEAREPTPPVAVSVSKAHRKGGGDIELSGDEVFRGLTVPVLKAVDHFRAQVEPPENWLYRSIRFLVPLVVLDAPMVGVTMIDGVASLEPLESVRLTITRPQGDDHASDLNSISGVDFVCLDALDKYVDTMQDWAQVLVSRIDQFAAQVVTGKALGDISVLLGEADAPEPPPSARLRPLLSKEAEAAWIGERFNAYHRSRGRD